VSRAAAIAPAGPGSAAITRSSIAARIPARGGATPSRRITSSGASAKPEPPCPSKNAARWKSHKSTQTHNTKAPQQIPHKKRNTQIPTQSLSKLPNPHNPNNTFPQQQQKNPTPTPSPNPTSPSHPKSAHPDQNPTTKNQNKQTQEDKKNTKNNQSKTRVNPINKDTNNPQKKTKGKIKKPKQNPQITKAQQNNENKPKPQTQNKEITNKTIQTINE
jgi:hypothetical protein